MRRYLILFVLSLGFSSQAFAIHENNRPQVLVSGIGLFSGYNALEYQLPLSDSGALAIGYFNGAPGAVSYNDATGYSIAYKTYFLPGKASFYKIGVGYFQDSASSNSSYAPILSMGMDLTDPSSPLAVNFEVGINAGTGANMYELNVGMRF